MKASKTERDIAFAVYDGVAAAEAIILLTEAIHGANTEMIVRSLNSEAATLYEYGRDRGSNVHLIASIILQRKLLDAASSDDERGTAQDHLGSALSTLGERESGTARLEEAVAAYHDALKERTRERVPLQWAKTQNNLGSALQTLGERESGTARLEEAVAAHRDALKEYTRERVPLQWARSFGNEGVALMLLAERGNAGMAETALSQINVALETMRDGGDAPNAAFYEQQLPRARAIVARLRGQ
jgi:tetratricopeptide (TPR) repeat protein